MKKLAFMFLVTLLAGGIAWGQISGSGHDGRVDLGVVPLLSTEATQTAGIFLADADGFIDPRFHDPEMEGTFLFLGGNVVLGSSIIFGNENRVDIGFGRNFGNLYMGLYFGGGFVTGEGTKLGRATGTPWYEVTTREADWDLNLALLLGIANMGFRLDFQMAGDSDRTYVETNDGDVVDRERSFGPSFALTWGAQFGALAPWARVGFRVADALIEEVAVNSPSYNLVDRTTSNGAFELSGGAEYSLNDDAVVGGELWFGNVSRRRERITETGEPDIDNRTFGGMTGFGLGVYYVHTINAGTAALGFSPNLNLGVTSTNRNRDFSPGTSYEVIGNRWFSLDLGLDLGVKWQATERIALISGVQLRVFDWTTWAQTGRDTQNNIDARDSAWQFSGIELSNLSIGMTFAATESINIGLGLNSFIDGLFGTRITPNFDFTVSARF